MTRPISAAEVPLLATLDRTCVTGIRVRGHHGVYDHERRDGQDFIIDVAWWANLAAAAASDDLNATINYGTVSSMVVDLSSTATLPSDTSPSNTSSPPDTPSPPGTPTPCGPTDNSPTPPLLSPSAPPLTNPDPTPPLPSPCDTSPSGTLTSNTFPSNTSSSRTPEASHSARVTSMVEDLVAHDPVDLIETLAERIAAALLDSFPCEYVQVSVHKPGAPLKVAFDDVILTSSVRARIIEPRRVVFSLGSNIEPRMEYLQFAVTALASTPGLTRVNVSPVYETAAVGDLPQADFLNAIVTCESALPAPQLLSRALDIEQLAHRTRDVAHGPRTLDIDLIAVGDERWNTPDLTLPHPRAAARAFVLTPWLALDPDATLLGVPANLKVLQDNGVHEWPERLFRPLA